MRSLKVFLRNSLLCLLVGAVVPQAAAIPIVSVQPSTQEVVVGQNFFVDISISDVTDLFTWGMAVAFDPAVIEAIGDAEGPFLQTGGTTFFIPGIINNAAGDIEAAATLLGSIPGVTGSGTLWTIEFKALAIGASTLSLFNISLFDSTTPGSNTIEDFDIVNGSVTVKRSSAAPEPAILALMGLGLAGIGYQRRKQNKAA